MYIEDLLMTFKALRFSPPSSGACWSMSISACCFLSDERLEEVGAAAAPRGDPKEDALTYLRRSAISILHYVITHYIAFIISIM